MNAKEKRRIPLEPAVITLGDAFGKGAGLRANQCTVCKLTFFPTREFCAKCSARIQGEVLLKDRGRLVSFANVHRKPLFSWIEPPYILGEIATDEGPNIFAIVRASPSELSVGMEMQLVLEGIRHDDEGNEVVGYTFRAVS